MAVKQLDALMVRKMFLSGARNLENHKALINELNVFPVPDGDTGTNMSLTIMSAAEAVEAVEDPTVESLLKAVSSGSLRGARGNSGVILSQLFRGFYKGVKSVDEITCPVMAVGMKRAVETAYKAVMKPKEGTILTVAKSVADKAQELGETAEDMGLFMEAIVKAGDETLDRTPEMLPVLKEAGVVDSGGMGLMMILHGFVEAYFGREITEIKEEPEKEALRFLYEADFAVEKDGGFTQEEGESLRASLESLGEDVKLCLSGEAIKASVMTNDPDKVLTKALKFGKLLGVDIKNREEESDPEITIKEEELSAPAEPEIPLEWRDTAFIAVSRGAGLNEVFKGLGVTEIIEGGQTMNPSTDDIMTAVEKAHAKTVYILPNNKNIILAANQAMALAKDCRVVVVPTKTIPQGITALLNYSPDMDADSNLETMTEEMSRVKTGEVTYAVRDTKIDGHEIHSGNIMGIGDGKILAVGEDIVSVTVDMLSEMVDDESELISLYRGEDMPEDKMEELQAQVEEAFPDCDIEVSEGGQPTYYCIASVE